MAILDVASRKVLSFRVSNTMTPDFCVDALSEAIARYGPPEIVNTDHGSQFTSKAWTDVVDAAGVRISMDGKGALDRQRIHRATLAVMCPGSLRVRRCQTQ
jgi:putative transposase